MKKVIAISFAFLILMSTIGFTFNKHNCGGKVHNKSLTLGVENLSCGMETQEQISGNMTIDTIDNSCCQNEFKEFKITDEFQPSTYKVDLDLKFAFAFVNTFIQIISIEKKQASKYLNYQPPLPDRDLPVLFQSFLI